LAHDLRHGYAFRSQRLNFFYKVRQELGFPAKLHAPISRFGNSVHLPFPPDVILELGNQRKSAHDKLPGAGREADQNCLQRTDGIARTNAPSDLAWS